MKTKSMYCGFVAVALVAMGLVMLASTACHRETNNARPAPLPVPAAHAEFPKQNPLLKEISPQKPPENSRKNLDDAQAEFLSALRETLTELAKNRTGTQESDNTNENLTIQE